MKCSVYKGVNGNFEIAQETTDIISAKVNFHNTCSALWNDSAEVKAEVKILDENLNCVDGYEEFIDHPAKQNN